MSTRKILNRLEGNESSLEAAIAESVLDPDYVKSSPGDVPVLAFMPGAEWQKRLDAMSRELQPFAEAMRTNEAK